jgi:cobalt-zinc-cadmium efflux system protein
VRVHAHHYRGRAILPLAVALALNAGYTAFEAAAGTIAGSVALLADAAHNLSDVLALAVALAAALLAGRPPTPARSFGWMRAEILSALFSGVLLVVLAAWIAVEALRRLDDPPEVAGGWLIGVAAAGIAVNAISAGVLVRSARQSLNVRASVVHLAGDALASAGVVVAGVVIALTGWNAVDPVAALVIGALILLSAKGVLSGAVHVLLEGVPRGIDAARVGDRMAAEPGVRDVHDLHVWEITSGFPALSAHVLVEPGGDCHGIRRILERALADALGVEHATVQGDHAQPARIQIRR